MMKKTPMKKKEMMKGKPVTAVGKPKGKMFAGGTPDFDEATGMKNLKGVVADRMKRTRKASK